MMQNVMHRHGVAESAFLGHLSYRHIRVSEQGKGCLQFPFVAKGTTSHPREHKRNAFEVACVDAVRIAERKEIEVRCADAAQVVVEDVYAGGRGILLVGHVVVAAVGLVDSFFAKRKDKQVFKRELRCACELALFDTCVHGLCDWYLFGTNIAIFFGNFSSLDPKSDLLYKENTLFCYFSMWKYNVVKNAVIKSSFAIMS